ncbi:hypothetical protein EDD85DRAFT_792176 [Armillaria nabsnona]|nr:hypothetical protein EDD85DRAFT_792176 [Armillaria nabsnona]
MSRDPQGIRNYDRPNTLQKEKEKVKEWPAFTAKKAKIASPAPHVSNCQRNHLQKACQTATSTITATAGVTQGQPFMQGVILHVFMVQGILESLAEDEENSAEDDSNSKKKEPEMPE